MSIFTLPSSTTPAEYFEREVAGILATVPVPANASREKSQITVDGAGSWNLSTADGKATLASGEVDSPFALITMDETTWHALCVGTVRDRFLEKVGGSGLLDRALTPERLARAFMPDTVLDAIRPHKGDLAVAIDDDEEFEEYRITVTLGGGTPNLDNPNALIKVEVDTWLALVSGRLKPQQALMGGKLEIEGDMSFPMSLMNALMAYAK